MFKTARGYAFEVKSTSNQAVDANGNPVFLLGVKEEFNYSFKGSIEKVSMTFGLDWHWDASKPAFLSKENGFVALSDEIAGDVDAKLNKFIRSNRAIYSINPALICTINGKLDRGTKVWLEGTRVNFYIYRNQYTTVYNGDKVSCVDCELLSATQGIHSFNLFAGDTAKLEAFICALTSRVLLGVAPCLDSKRDFLLYRATRRVY